MLMNWVKFPACHPTLLTLTTWDIVDMRMYSMMAMMQSIHRAIIKIPSETETVPAAYLCHRPS